MRKRFEIGWLGATVMLGTWLALFAVGAEADEPSSKAKATAAAPEKQTVDVVRLSNGNKIMGHVVAMENGMVTIAIDGVGEMEMPLSDVTSVTKELYVPPKQPSRAEQRVQEQRWAQERQEAKQDYREALDRRMRQAAFDEDRRRQLQMEADWREFLNHPNINRRFQEDMFFLRFGGPWGRFAPWGSYVPDSAQRQ